MPDFFERSEYDSKIPIHRVVLAGLEAMQAHADFDPERTHVIVMIHDTANSTVSPLNYPPTEGQGEAVVQDALQHLRVLAERLDISLIILNAEDAAKQNGAAEHATEDSS